MQAGPIQPGSLRGGLKKGAEEGPDLGRGGDEGEGRAVGRQERKLNTEEQSEQSKGSMGGIRGGNTRVRDGNGEAGGKSPVERRALCPQDPWLGPTFLMGGGCA